MQHYNPKDWFGLIFKFHKSDTFRKLFWVIFSLVIFSTVVIYVELEVLSVKLSSTVMHSLLGFVISLLLVFRTNTAYDRWWEGRKQWGALVNVSRNVLLKVFSIDTSIAHKKELQKLVGLYALALKEHLRDKTSAEIASIFPSDANFETKPHMPNAIAQKMQVCIRAINQESKLDQGLYLALLEDLNQFTDICGACERIKRSPIPYTYNIFIKKFIFVYIITMPFAFAASFEYWTILVTTFTFYTLASLELIAEVIEDPFGNDADDLPTDDLAITIARNAQEISEY
jgi:putative membrane protein